MALRLRTASVLLAQRVYTFRASPLSVAPISRIVVRSLKSAGRQQQSGQRSETREGQFCALHFEDKYFNAGACVHRITLVERNVTLALYATAGAIAIMGLSYAAVPLYQMFCQHCEYRVSGSFWATVSSHLCPADGVGGTTQVATIEKFKTVRPVAGVRTIILQCTCPVSSTLRVFSAARRPSPLLCILRPILATRCRGPSSRSKSRSLSCLAR
jgi:hypothetical protein